jgi:hypothetical protein
MVERYQVQIVRPTCSTDTHNLTGADGARAVRPPPRRDREAAATRAGPMLTRRGHPVRCGGEPSASRCGSLLCHGLPAQRAEGAVPAPLLRVPAARRPGHPELSLHGGRRSGARGVAGLGCGPCCSVNSRRRRANDEVGRRGATSLPSPPEPSSLSAEHRLLAPVRREETCVPCAKPNSGQEDARACIAPCADRRRL